MKHKHTTFKLATYVVSNVHEYSALDKNNSTLKQTQDYKSEMWVLIFTLTLY